MSIFHDKTLKSVAEAAAKVMAETSHGSHPKTPKEKSLAALAHPKDKITHKDVLVGRGVLKKEDIEQLDEVGDTKAGRKALHSYVNKAITNAVQNPDKRTKGVRKATSRLYKDNYYGKKTNEEVVSEGDTYDKDRYAVQNGKATKDNPSHMGSANYKDQPHHVWATSSDEALKKKMNKEEVEQLQEYESKNGVYKHKAKLEKGVQYGETDWDKEEKEAKKMSSPKRAQKGYGPRQNYKRSTRVNESLSFTEMLELYSEHGIKVLAPIETEEMDIDGTTIEVIDADKVNGFVETAVEEEVTNDQFTKEFEDQKASFEGKKPQPKVAAGKTTGVKNMPEEVEQIDENEEKENARKMYHKHFVASMKVMANSPKQKHHQAEMAKYRAMMGDSFLDQVAPKKFAKFDKKIKEEVELDERTLTSGESKKKEEYVKGMKKSLSGFKQRYGERAKSVMYATATKMAKKD